MSVRDLDVSARQVLERNVAPVVGMLSNTRGQGEAVREIQGTVIITFAELERDDEAIILNPDVRAYLRELHNAVPHLFYYLHPEPGFGSVSGFITAFSDDSNIGTIDGQIYAKPDEKVSEMLIDRLVQAARFAEERADDWQGVIQGFADGVTPEMMAVVLSRMTPASD